MTCHLSQAVFLSCTAGLPDSPYIEGTQLLLSVQLMEDKLTLSSPGIYKLSQDEKKDCISAMAPVLGSEITTQSEYPILLWKLSITSHITLW